MAFFNSAVQVLQTLVVALGAGLGIWGAINLMEGKALEKDIKRGEYYVDGYKISFSPDMIYKKDEK